MDRGRHASRQTTSTSWVLVGNRLVVKNHLVICLAVGTGAPPTRGPAQGHTGIMLPQVLFHEISSRSSAAA